MDATEVTNPAGGDAPIPAGSDQLDPAGIVQPPPATNPTAESASANSQPHHPERAFDNEAVLRCYRAYVRAYNQTIAECEQDVDPEDEVEAEKNGRLAFMRALPPLAGYDNIRDFIASVAYALANELMYPKDAERLFEAAKVALGAIKQQALPKPAAKRRPGRPRKNLQPEENK